MNAMFPPHAVPSRQRLAPAEDMEHATHSKAKRRKLRKGTHSCWECKRRKMRCIFDPLNNAVCNACRRRGSKCVSQEFSDDTSIPMGTTSRTGDSGVGGGKSIDQVRSDHGFPTPSSMSSEPARVRALYKSSEGRFEDNDSADSSTQYTPQFAADATASQDKYARLSRLLHESLPSREDTERICKACRHPSVLGHEILTMRYAVLDQNGLKRPETLLEMPEPDQHPVLIARYMLRLAIFLHHLHPDLHEELKALSESPRSIAERLSDVAINLVTTKDELLGSIEGLECVMIESAYQTNVGNLRRSWVAGRRAMGIAQLMGLHRSGSRTYFKVLDHKTQYSPQTMWFRIVDLDRHLCLMLGLPQGSLDRNMASETLLANDVDTGRLERLNCVLASRILERNESGPNPQGLDLTRTLDAELQRAARSLPSKWWLAPTLYFASADSQALFWATRRMFAQIIHYNLLNQLHLPYMLCSSSGDRKYEYSRITCVNASREVLSRFIALRSFNKIAHSCRMVDFLAVMAAMTLLLAHLDSHGSEGQNLLAHQYFSDRAMIEQAQENMRELNRLNSDALSAQSADLLRRLLAIDNEAADGLSPCTPRVSVQEAGSEAALPEQDDDTAVSVHIPYFGVIRIAREGLRKETPKPRPSTTSDRPDQIPRANTSSATDMTTPHMRPQIRSSEFALRSVNSEIATPVDAGYDHINVSSKTSQEALGAHSRPRKQPQEPSAPSNNTDDVATNFAQPVQTDPLSQFGLNDEYPGLIAGGEDWAFQGVDMAFFDNLMGSVGDDSNDNTDWKTWQRWS
ncbi:putative Zn(2)-C6 fungal-type domain-containing protein [Seiridium cardinale]|uniref:Zn(2)-C6 fungal-type domain-containing protein n=1 Tax=Seiridium cardinale TaxID=138064 RepID=A0ABR2XYJ4_9PEZI